MQVREHLKKIEKSNAGDPNLVERACSLFQGVNLEPAESFLSEMVT